MQWEEYFLNFPLCYIIYEKKKSSIKLKCVGVTDNKCNTANKSADVRSISRLKTRDSAPTKAINLRGTLIYALKSFMTVCFSVSGVWFDSRAGEIVTGFFPLDFFRNSTKSGFRTG